MKVKNNLFAAFLLTALTVFVACEKNVISMPGDTPIGARVKFIQACSNCSVINTAPTPSINVLITANGQTINPTGLTYGAAFPTNGYAVLPTGEVTLNFVRSDSGQTIFSSKVNLSDGKYYSIYVGDTIPTPTISLIEDDIKPFQDTSLRIRLVNVLSGKTKDTLELWHQNAQKVVGANVTYGKASEFAFTPGISDTFFYRKVGTTVMYPLSTTVVFAGSKALTLTILARGLNNKTTGVQTAKLDWWRNR